MAKTSATDRILNKIRKDNRSFEPKSPIASGMYLPNDSQVKGADNKLRVKGFTDGSVLFVKDAKIEEDNFNLFWDDANNRLEPNLIKITSDGTQASPALKFNDTNTGFFKSGDSVRFSLNNSTKMTIDATGVGIGTNNPLKPLHVVGGIALTEGTINDRIESGGTNRVTIRTGGATALRLINQAHTIMGQWGVANVGLKGPSGGSGNSNRAGVEFTLSSGESTGDGASAGIIFQYSPSGSSGTQENALVEGMRLDGSGKVGIGTTNPDTKVHLSANTGATLRIESTDTAITAGEEFGVIEFETQDATNPGVSARIVDVAEGVGGNASLVFETASAGTLAAHMTLDSGGNLFFTGDSTGLPFAEIYARDNTATTSTSTTKAQILIFDTNGESNAMTPDHAQDHITVVKAGKYKIDASISIKNSSGAAHVISLEMYKNNGTGVFNNIHAGRTLGTGAEVGNLTMSGIVDLAVDDTIEFWITSDSGAARTVTVEDIDFCAIQVGGT